MADMTKLIDDSDLLCQDLVGLVIIKKSWYKKLKTTSTIVSLSKTIDTEIIHLYYDR